MRNRKAYHVTVVNRFTGEAERVDIVREFGIDIPRDLPYEADTFHAIDWIDQRTLDAWFKRQAAKRQK